MRIAISSAVVSCLLLSCSGGGGTAPGTSSGGACDPGAGDTRPIPSKVLQGTIGGRPFTARTAFGSASSVSDGSETFSIWIVDDAPSCSAFFANGTVKEALAIEVRVPGFVDGYTGVVTGKCGGLPEINLGIADETGTSRLYGALGRIELSGAPAAIGERGTVRVRAASESSNTSFEGEIPFTFCLDQRSKR